MSHTIFMMSYIKLFRKKIKFVCWILFQGKTIFHLIVQKRSKIRTGTEKSSKICAQQLHCIERTPGCVTNIVKSLKWENLEDRRKSARLSMLFKIQHELIDIDRQQYLTQNDSRIRGKNRSYQERSKTYIRTIILP